ncbi:MAG: winged helix-turn-helix domain-containing protein [Dehalococcoidia bacterium]
MRALLVALDLPTASQISSAIERSWPGSLISLAETVDDARTLLEREHVDVVLLGASAANGGLQLCADVCATAPVPVILVTGRRGLIDRVRAAELGIQAVLWLPLTEAAVVEMVNSARYGEPTPTEPPRGSFVADGLEIDYDKRTVVVDGAQVELSPVEYRLLYHLTRNANSVLAYETLIAKVWGRRPAADTTMLRVLIDRLGIKLPVGVQGQYAIVRRAGYGFGFSMRAALRD